MRVLKDVVVHRTDSDELLSVSRTTGIVGEEMTLDIMGAGTRMGLRVRVLESRPVIVDGSVCFRMRLALLNAESTAAVEPGTAAAHQQPAEEPVAPLSMSGPLAEAI
jgi:hypothetical protein